MTGMRVIQCIASMHEAAAGTTVYIDRLASLLEAEGIDTTVMTSGRTAEENGLIHTLPVDAPHRGPLASLVSATRPSRALKGALIEEARRASAIHSHGLWLLPNVYPGLATRKAGIPLVVSPHGMLAHGALQFSRLKKKLFWAAVQRHAVANAACWHATSDKEAADIRAFGIRAPIAIVPIGVDLPPVQILSSPRAQEILFLGRLHPIKGIERLLRVWPTVAARHPDWTLRIVGPNDAQGMRYRTDAAARTIPSLVFGDAVYGKEKWEAYRRAALFVLPTTNENFGITVTEALAAETPVVCSDGAPWGGLVTEGAGWWIEQSDTALLAALESAITLPDAKRREMGTRGRAWMARDFAWNSVVSKMAQLYAWVAHGGHRPDFIDA